MECTPPAAENCEVVRSGCMRKIRARVGEAGWLRIACMVEYSFP